jgi:primosomal protein N'
MERYESAHKPKSCPACGSKRIASIMYGYPLFSEELEQKLEAGEIALGGCCISDDDPVWEFADCKAPIYRI